MANYPLPWLSWCIGVKARVERNFFRRDRLPTVVFSVTNLDFRVFLSLGFWSSFGLYSFSQLATVLRPPVVPRLLISLPWPLAGLDTCA